MDELKLRELASAATPGPWAYSQEAKIATVATVSDYRVGPDHGSPDMACYDHHAPDEADAAYVAAANPAAILALLDELQTLRSECTAWRVSAENAEEKKTQLQEFSKLACRALDDCSRVLTTIDGESMHEQDQIEELNTRVTNLAVQALVLNGLIHRGQLEETP